MSESDGAPPGPSKTRRVVDCENSSSESELPGNVIGSCWSLLPPEMVEQVLDALVSSSTQDAFNARTVCHQWNDILLPKLPFGGVLNDQTIHTISRLDPKVQLKTLILTRLDSSTVDGDGFENTDEHARKNTCGGTAFNPNIFRRSVEHLILGGDVGAFLKLHGSEEELPFSLSTGFAEDHNLLKQVDRSVDGSDLANILPQLKNVRTLTLTSIAFYSVSYEIMRRLDFSNQFSTITKLDICIGSKTDVDKILIFFRKAECPHLLSLYIRVYSFCFHLLLYISYYRFIAKHPHLKNLSISQTQSFYQVPTYDTNNLNLSLYRNRDIFSGLMKIQLECLRIDGVVGGSPVVGQWKALEQEFIKNQRQLRSLELQLCFRSLGSRVDQLLPRCEQTLERLEISATNNIPNRFDCEGISNFKKLSQCHLFMRKPSPHLLCLHPQELGGSRVTRINMLPRCITSLHLGEVPNVSDIRSLKDQLVNLKRISYVGPDSDDELSSYQFLCILVEHLKFPVLSEFRIYRYSCSVVFNFLNAQKGIVCYSEEEDTMVIFVERDEFDLENVLKAINIHSNSMNET